ncbi:hypothetical protein T10_7287 [Trichinella papuae]|uniref:Uncharacterized protein n=1 Tax=Trichinella papuae TaxID=268474 RepID=A0A0V1N577_9BILA|nr:hypothetical protein T10_7287 [Trichinella papuae]
MDMFPFLLYHNVAEKERNMHDMTVHCAFSSTSFVHKLNAWEFSMFSDLAVFKHGYALDKYCTFYDSINEVHHRDHPEIMLCIIKCSERGVSQVLKETHHYSKNLKINFENSKLSIKSENKINFDSLLEGAFIVVKSDQMNDVDLFELLGGKTTCHHSQFV